MQILECQHHWLNPSPRHHPIVQRRQLPAAEFLGRQTLHHPFRGQRYIHQRGQKRRVLQGVELDLLQRAVEVGKTPLRRDVGAAKTLAAPFRNRMERGVLQ
jgi:hypothetical protein